jgi:dienelactone hydrolase
VAVDDARAALEDLGQEGRGSPGAHAATPTVATGPGIAFQPGGTVNGGLLERRFDVRRDGRLVPGILWTPAAGGRPSPLVLLGHGGSGSKREGYVVKMGRHLAAAHGVAAAAIDGPVHGDRRPDPDAPQDLVVVQFAQLWANDGEAMTDAMVADWQAVLDRLLTLDGVRPDACGWWGLSMGTIIGLPLVAREPRIHAAVLGLMGMTGPTRARIERDAPAVRCPTLFLAQWSDAVFPLGSAIELFEAIGSRDKRFYAHAGGHGDVPAEAFALSARFLAERLAAGD